MECKPLIEKLLWNSIVIFIWVHFFFWKKMHLQQHLLLLNHKNLSSCLVLGLWHFRTFNNNFFWSIPLVCRCSKVEIGFSEGQLPGSFGVLLSRWLCWVRGALKILLGKLGISSQPGSKRYLENILPTSWSLWTLLWAAYDKVATGGKKRFSNRPKFLHVFIRQLRHRSDLKMKEGEIRRSCTSGLQDFADVGWCHSGRWPLI